VVKASQEAHLGARVPKEIAQEFRDYCKTHGIKQEFGLTQAVSNWLCTEKRGRAIAAAMTTLESEAAIAS
jgi:hypothetical protein